MQMQAWLVLENYPDVDCVRVTIWNLRENVRTYSVDFRRCDSEQFAARVRHAAGLAVMHGSSASVPPGWPSEEKCELCPVARWCNVGDAGNMNPGEMVEALSVLGRRSDELTKLLEKHVRDSGSDIETKSGLCFGFQKPKTRKPTAPKPSLYSVANAATSDESE